MESLESQLTNFEELLEDGLVKVCRNAGLMDEVMTSPDIDGKWEEFIRDYVADGISNYNSYPDAALGFAAYLGMGVAHHWDGRWEAHRLDTYSSYYGNRGYDNMDDHIVSDILRLSREDTDKVKQALQCCTAATEALIRHQEIEPQTSTGFYALVRCFSVFFRIGVSIELYRLGYKKEPVNITS